MSADIFGACVVISGKNIYESQILQKKVRMNSYRRSPSNNLMKLDRQNGKHKSRYWAT